MHKLVRFSPSVESRGFQDEFDRVFDTFFPGLQRENGASTWLPRMDFVERKDVYEVRMDAAGMSKKDFSIDFRDGALTISGERQMQEREESDVLLRTERPYGRFTRTFALPRTVNHDKIQASYPDGVLTVVVPKSEESKPRKITVS